MKEIKIFDNRLNLKMSDDDWDFLCKYRLFNQNPDIETIENEFITGTGITPNKEYLWGISNISFSEYIEDLRKIQAK